MTVIEPPPSTLRAMPKNLRGISIARESRPPDSVRPEPGPRLLKARAMRVRLSTSSTTSWPHSASQRTWAMVSSHSLTCDSMLWSLLLARTSAGTERRKWVTSSGRSSTSSTTTRESGESAQMALVSSSSMTVLPVRGGATIRPRVPRASGANSSTMRMVDPPWSPMRKRRSGFTASSFSNGVRLR